MRFLPTLEAVASLSINILNYSYLKQLHFYCLLLVYFSKHGLEPNIIIFF